MLYPLKKSNDLIELINSMIASGPNELTIASVRRDALKLQNAGQVVDAKQVFGMLAAFQGDYDEVERAFGCAVSASGNSFLVLLNYAVALSNVRRHRQAVDVAIRVEARAPDDIEVLVQTLGVHLDAYNVNGAKSVITRLKHLGKDVSIRGIMAESQLAYKSALLASNQVAWEDMAARIELAGSVLSTCGFPPMSYTIMETEGDDAVLYEIFLRTDAGGAAAAEDAIVQAIADQPYSKVDNAIVFYCLPA